MPLLLGSRRRRESLSGKHVLITGGSEGVGLEVAKIAAARGARVSLVARTMSKLHAARDELASSAPGAAVGVFSGDVGDGAALGAAIEQAESQLGPVDVCIAAAGAAMPKYFEELRIADYERMMTVNYYGVLHAARHVLPKMAERSAADPSVTPHFVAVASMVAAVPFIGYAAYAPSKAACRSLLDVLRNEYADTAVQLHIAFPPDMDTPGFQKEQETKPYETRHIWPEMFNELFPPDKAASRLLDDLRTAATFSVRPTFSATCSSLERGATTLARGPSSRLRSRRSSSACTA
ncbi:hypothetical protein EMIHUDRAFT_419354 [Emiliania huxleyi CCMP1516]|uniref:Ketoreductase domain-containing protein n=2 Tax=Emiliania huxleyi TaxID=2903 RepID=A0A0D3J503_EMIH1|nr:hypothetical protein EMIHUDRAFT_419354 [Emiliania huxleyi CCMP1516]EOD18588.1 hypothetical protein EMIHUDRAFT_419354 [Emiliania huxleyi CCMP1516]|eukprot:XP_005771017.1 hypothetical protein EMIHUDRAFT_419354 [Emiliania huxleyi CCMP1516]